MDKVTFETEKVSESTSKTNQTDKPKSQNENSAKPTDVKTNNQENTMPKKSKKKNTSTIIIAVIMVLAGIVTGYGIYAASSNTPQETATTTTTPEAPDQVAVGEVYGAQNGETFTDEAEGVLVKGGVKGEGSHHLLREGGPSKNVYLTSSILDLSLFEGHLVKVWGETFQAQQAGWLMDAGKVEVIELNAQPPFEEEPIEE